MFMDRHGGEAIPTEIRDKLVDLNKNWDKVSADLAQTGLRQTDLDALHIRLAWMIDKGVIPKTFNQIKGYEVTSTTHAVLKNGVPWTNAQPEPQGKDQSLTKTEMAPTPELVKPGELPKTGSLALPASSPQSDLSQVGKAVGCNAQPMSMSILDSILPKIDVATKEEIVALKAEWSEGGTMLFNIAAHEEFGVEIPSYLQSSIDKALAETDANGNHTITVQMISDARRVLSQDDEQLRAWPFEGTQVGIGEGRPCGWDRDVLIASNKDRLH
jgi:hypothetical protein